MLRQAEAACYLAKDRGRNRIHVYKSDDRHRTCAMGRWLDRSIHQALQDDRFLLCRQASVALTPAETPHFEILLRMLEAGRPVSCPTPSFLGRALRTHAGDDRWVINAALTKLGIETKHSICSLNLSGASVGDYTLTEYVEAQIKAARRQCEGCVLRDHRTAGDREPGAAESMIMDMKELAAASRWTTSARHVVVHLPQAPARDLPEDRRGVLRHMDTDPIDRAMVERSTTVAT